MKKRTICVIPCKVSVLSEDWKHSAFISKPFNEAIQKGSDFRLLKREDLKEDQHPIHLAMNWREAIENKYFESSTQIAQELGVTSGRVRQIIRLNNLHPKIIKSLLEENTQELRSSFRIKNLMKASSLTHEDQLIFFKNNK